MKLSSRRLTFLFYFLKKNKFDKETWEKNNTNCVPSDGLPCEENVWLGSS